jgi:hypothetical protein
LSKVAINRFQLAMNGDRSQTVASKTPARNRTPRR